MGLKARKRDHVFPSYLFISRRRGLRGLSGSYKVNYERIIQNIVDTLLVHITYIVTKRVINIK